MKRIGILFGLFLLSACMIWAQDNKGNSDSNANSGNNAAPSQTTTSSTTTTTTTTSNDDSSIAQNQSQQTTDNNSRNAAAANEENAADSQKQAAKDAGSKEESDHDKAIARLDDAAKDLNQLLAAPDQGIPDDVFAKAKCVAVVPSMIKGGFIFGAEHGRGVASCRLPNGGWSAPAFFVVSGGSWGAQIGAEGVDLTLLIMNDNGMNQLLSSKFKIGASASAAAGPVGRQAEADTSWKMNSEVLTYSRSRGLFAGATLNGAVIKADDDSMRGYYGRTVGFRPALTGQAKDPMMGKDAFTAALHKNRAEVTNAQAH
jgi:lipid-binding SYLF domain-containing protein